MCIRCRGSHYVGTSASTQPNYYQQQTTVPKSNTVVKMNKTKSKNTPISDDLLEFYKSGQSSLNKLSEREIQEMIAEQEKVYGRLY